MLAICIIAKFNTYSLLYCNIVLSESSNCNSIQFQSNPYSIPVIRDSCQVDKLLGKKYVNVRGINHAYVRRMIVMVISYASFERIHIKNTVKL